MKDEAIVTGSVATKPPKRAMPPRIAKAAVAPPTAIEPKAAPERAEPPLKAPAPEKTKPDAAPPKPPSADAPAGKTTIPAPPAKTAPTAEPPLPPVDDPAAVAQMLSEGQALFDQGKVVQARRRFVAAMNGPVPDVLLALARSYDTYYLSRLPTADGAPDMQRALVLYERALERGAKEAAADLERTRGVLKVPR